MSKKYLSILSVFGCVLATSQIIAADSRHVVVVVWDGMRPDFVSEQNTPTLWKLAQSGVTFRNHHSVYPSATNVNGVAIATGVYPGHSGILANHVYRPELDAKKSIDVEASAVVEKGDQWSAGKYVAAPTLAELVQDAGKTTAIATAKTVGLLLDRHVDPARAKKSVTLFAGASLPGDAAASLANTLGVFPPATNAGDRDAWTVKALTDFLWREQLPAFSLLWLSEPDDTEHKTAPGMPAALAAIKSADENLARVLAALDRLHARETTDVFVVSDHGFSTISRSIDLSKILKAAGLRVFTEFSEEPKVGDIMMVGNGGSVLFYVMQQDAAVTRRLVDFLQQSNFAGVIFTKQRTAGTFKLSVAKIDNETSPDVVLAFRWSDSNNQLGVPGMIDADWQRAVGKGTHATLSRFDMHNTLIAAGPDFRGGLTSDLPSGNVDLAPTILRILGIGGGNMDGRVLSEAMGRSASRTDSSRGEIDNPVVKPETETLEATNDFPIGKWRQYLRVSRVGSTIYLDEGNGSFVASKREND
ncbi:MAG: alkaline phosphatase family protein [Spartobacteria bacterium]